MLSRSGGVIKSQVRAPRTNANTMNGQAINDHDLPRHLLRRFWGTAITFWHRKAGITAWALAGGLLLIIVLVVGATYAMNLWNRAIFDNLQNKDAGGVARLTLVYFVLLALSAGLSAAQTYLRMALQRRWRVWLNDCVVDRWVSHGRHYQLNLVRGDHANPEYRIADDVRVATESILCAA
jgi:putative ATP-binding cassette transporter